MSLVSPQTLRTRMLATRAEMDSTLRTRLVEQIIRRLTLMPEFRSAQKVGLYPAFEGEIPTDTLFHDLHTRRREAYYPVIGEGHSPQGCPPQGVDTLAYIRVPQPSDVPLQLASVQGVEKKFHFLRDLSELDVLVVPGIAFDLRGGRLGFGGGKYDRCLKTFRGRRIALAYEFQVVPDLPSSVRGRLVDWIVTESRIIRCSEGSAGLP